MKVNDKIEMMSSDYAENINHYDFSIDSAIKIQGWRLPSVEELRLLFLLHRNQARNFSSEWYMTNEVKEWENFCINFGDGREVYRRIEESHWGCCCVRLVRDLR